MITNNLRPPINIYKIFGPVCEGNLISKNFAVRR
jgi:hypothetical protein